MSDKLEFEEIYEAYNLCLKNKKRKMGTYCYVITEPALREIYAAQFSDRIVQHFYMKEIKQQVTLI